MKKYEEVTRFEAEVTTANGKKIILTAKCMNEDRSKKFRVLHEDKRSPEKKTLDFMVLIFGRTKFFYRKFSTKLLSNIFLDYCNSIANPPGAQEQPAKS